MLWRSCFKMHTFAVAWCRYGDNDDVTCIARVNTTSYLFLPFLACSLFQLLVK